MNRPLKAADVPEIEAELGDILEKAAHKPRRERKTANGRMGHELNLGVEFAGTDVRDILEAISTNLERVVGAKADVADESVVKLMNGVQEVRGFLFGTY